MQTFIRSAKHQRVIKRIGAHHHDTHQILYVVKGCAEITVDGESFLLKSGSLIFISRMESHSINVLSDSYERYELRISPEILAADIKNARLYSVLLNRPSGFNRVITLPISLSADILEKITVEYESNNAYRDEMLNSLLDIFFINIYRSFPKMFSDTEIPAFETVQKIQQQFENDIASRYTLDILAEQYHISKFYLSHIFKTVTGYSVMDYLKTLRIARAKNMLAKTACEISEIVKICGFSDSSNFSREFKAITKFSPRDFRKKHNPKG